MGDKSIFFKYFWGFLWFLWDYFQRNDLARSLQIYNWVTVFQQTTNSFWWMFLSIVFWHEYPIVDGGYSELSWPCGNIIWHDTMIMWHRRVEALKQTRNDHASKIMFWGLIDHTVFDQVSISMISMISREDRCVFARFFVGLGFKFLCRGLLNNYKLLCPTNLGICLYEGSCALPYPITLNEINPSAKNPYILILCIKESKTQISNVDNPPKSYGNIKETLCKARWLHTPNMKSSQVA